MRRQDGWGKSCLVQGCGKPVFVKKHGLCTTHYHRQYRHGPEANTPVDLSWVAENVRRNPGVSQAKNIKGQRFGRLVAVELIGFKYGARWRLACDCGGELTAYASDLGRHTRSCGCLQVELARSRVVTHGMSDTPTFAVWASMHSRCNDKRVKNYGAIGVSVCARWKSFQSFLEDMGERPPRMTLDRINPYGNYEPSNCRWASTREQARNKRTTTFLEHDGIRLSIPDWADRIGMPVEVLRTRVKVYGWPASRALTTPMRKLPRRKLRTSA